MVVHSEAADPSADRVDRLFHALADATRREIVALTLGGEYSVTELAGRFPMSFAAVQKHVAVLADAGLVVKQRRGREQRVRGDPDVLREARDLLDRMEALWRGRLDRIATLLDEALPPAGPPSPGPQSTAPQSTAPQSTDEGAPRCP